ncbi:hypothetical protein [Parvicella tangerina]|nr:hypothetical protein [Parvicella tangerina]
MAFWIPFALSLVVAMLMLIFFKRQIKTRNHVLMVTVSFILISLTTFFFNAYYPEDFENRQTTIIVDKEIEEALLSQTEAQITCYLLVTCPYCEIASKKLNALYNSEKVSSIELVYFAHQQTADSLVTANNINIPYRIIENDSIFFTRAGKIFPSIQLQKDKELIHWSGNNVNFACFDELMKYDKK